MEKELEKGIQNSIFDVFYQVPDQTRKKTCRKRIGFEHLAKKIIEYPRLGNLGK